MLALRVPNLEMHIYANGRHPGDPLRDGSHMTGGLTDRKGIPFGTWQFRFIDWFRDLGFLEPPGVETKAAKDIAFYLSQPVALSVEPPAGATLLLAAAGDGSQVYTCTDGHWVLKAPDARLLDEHGQAIGTHFAGPTWRLNGWQRSKRQSHRQPACFRRFLCSLPIAASRSRKRNRQVRERDATSDATETHGGAAGTDPCTSGEKRVPYTAKYSFYTANHDQYSSCGGGGIFSGRG